MMMKKNRVWSVPFLLPIAVGACSAPADGSPFEARTPATDNAAAPAADQTPSPAPAPDTAPPAASTPGAAEGGADDALPVSPTPAESNGPEPPDEGSSEPPDAAQPEPQTPTSDSTECASYETGFLPEVVEPVCSRCHTSGRGLPLFEPFAQAEARCAQIGRLVSTGEMPPGGGLSAEQRAVVASWVSLDCPETAEGAAAACVPSVTPAPDPTLPPPTGDEDDDDEEDEEDEDDDDDDDDDD
jgi:hypothetical protein